jgi:hypothetical protein
MLDRSIVTPKPMDRSFFDQVLTSDLPASTRPQRLHSAQPFNAPPATPAQLVQPPDTSVPSLDIAPVPDPYAPSVPARDAARGTPLLGSFAPADRGAGVFSVNSSPLFQVDFYRKSCHDLQPSLLYRLLTSFVELFDRDLRGFLS